MSGEVYINGSGDVYLVEASGQYIHWRYGGRSRHAGDFRRDTLTEHRVCTTEELHQALTLIKEKQA